MTTPVVGHVTPLPAMPCGGSASLTEVVRDLLVIVADLTKRVAELEKRQTP